MVKIENFMTVWYCYDGFRIDWVIIPNASKIIPKVLPLD